MFHTLVVIKLTYFKVKYIFIKVMSVLIVGSVALDTIKTPFGSVKEALGGSAIYASYAASFFSPVKVVGVVGDDFPKKYLQQLAKRNIDISGIEIKEGKTFRWSGWYDYDLHHAHTISTELNVFSKFSPKIPEHFKKVGYVFLANIDPDLQLSVLKQVNRPKIVVADTMNYWIENKFLSLKKVIKKTNIMLVNDGEARQITKKFNLLEASREILKQGADIIIIKKGEHGCLMVKGKEIFCAPAFPLEVISDPTGAGDSFAGGFVGYLSRERKITTQTIRKAIIWGSVIASFNVEGFGLERLFSLTYREINKRYQQFKKLVHFEKV